MNIFSQKVQGMGMSHTHLLFYTNIKYTSWTLYGDFIQKPLPHYDMYFEFPK